MKLCHRCGKHISKNNLLRHLKICGKTKVTFENQQSSCPRCNKYESKNNMLRHLKICGKTKVTCENQRSCPSCRMLITVSNLNRHTKKCNPSDRKRKNEDSTIYKPRGCPDSSNPSFDCADPQSKYSNSHLSSLNLKSGYSDPQPIYCTHTLDGVSPIYEIGTSESYVNRFRKYGRKTTFKFNKPPSDVEELVWVRRGFAQLVERVKESGSKTDYLGFTLCSVNLKAKGSGYVAFRPSSKVSGDTLWEIFGGIIQSNGESIKTLDTFTVYCTRVRLPGGAIFY